MPPELIEIDGQLYGGILREDSGKVSCPLVTDVRQLNCVPIPRGKITATEPFFDWWVAAFLICAGVICVAPYFVR